jgi:hypothetical protein
MMTGAAISQGRHAMMETPTQQQTFTMHPAFVKVQPVTLLDHKGPLEDIFFTTKEVIAMVGDI